MNDFIIIVLSKTKFILDMSLPNLISKISFWGIPNSHHLNYHQGKIKQLIYLNLTHVQILKKKIKIRKMTINSKSKSNKGNLQNKNQSQFQLVFKLNVRNNLSLVPSLCGRESLGNLCKFEQILIKHKKYLNLIKQFIVSSPIKSQWLEIVNL